LPSIDDEDDVGRSDDIFGEMEKFSADGTRKMHSERGETANVGLSEGEVLSEEGRGDKEVTSIAAESGKTRRATCPG